MIYGKKNRLVIPPKGGWKESTWYIAEVSFAIGNPIHKSLLYSGFLTGKDKEPGGYSALVAYTTPYDGTSHLSDATYIKVLRELIIDETEIENMVIDRFANLLRRK